jgi:hypothetical protein
MKGYVMKRVIIVVALAAMCFGCQTLPPQHSHLRFPANYIEYQFDARKWKVGHQAGNQTEFISEWVLPGESVENWSELISTYIRYESVKIEQLVTSWQNLLGKDSIEFQTTILSKSPEVIVFEWSHKGNGKWPAQREIKSVMQGSDGVYTLSYTVKESSFSQQQYNKWRSSILEARLRPMPKPNKSGFVETLNGGFLFDTGKVYIIMTYKAKESTNTSVYAVAKFENPIRGGKPLETDLGKLNLEQNLIIKSPHFNAIENHRTYGVELHLYFNKEKTKLIEIHKDQIRFQVTEDAIKKFSLKVL